MATTDTLHLDLILQELDTRLLLAFARDRGHSLRGGDLGYAVHCWLREVWGENWPKPFMAEDRGRMVQVLAYHRQEASDREQSWQACDADLRAIAHNQLPGHKDRSPAAWREGMSIGFQCLGCPSKRLARGASLPPAPNDPNQRQAGPGDEVDAWQHYLARNPDTPAHPALREEVYSTWFRERLGADCGAELLAVRVANMQRQKLLRRTQDKNREKRKTKEVELPAVTFDGVLRITNPEAFTQTLAKGIGRHRAFGFGMLLLKPALG
ncbi:MAG: type I-E CRISPR-associated protein Cas6/Cse3/CasE [Planctomycetota bacterium]|nr:MAG: type I-E CRISPR-associated protein Cas6/Cse3/CasE [Planctomycetota bacterium]